MLVVAGRESGHMREVWHGPRLCDAAVPLPAPLHVASAPCFFDLEDLEDGTLRVKKMAGKCASEQLHLSFYFAGL
jgi:hypothetical protein